MKHALFGGAFPAWHPNGNILLGVIGTSPTSIWKRFVRYDFLQSKPIDTLSAAVGGDNRSPRYSPDGTKIAFWSKLGDGSGNIWVMNSDGSNPQQLTTEGATDWLSWNPDGGRIAYVSHRYTDWTYSNGTIWVVNVETGEKQQLTFNHPRK
jgi:Tol biopolymer transport system component